MRTKHKHLEAKQYVTNQPMDHQGNQTKNLKKILEDKWKRNTMIQNLRDTTNTVLRGKFIAI